MNMNEELLKSLNGAIDAAIKELASVDELAKGDISLQEAKLRPESSNGSLPGHDGGAVSDSTLKPEDAKKAESADCDPAEKADDEDEKSKDKDDSDDDEMDDDKADKWKAKIKKYEEDKAAKAANPASASMTKSDIDNAAETLKKSIVEHVEEVMQKSFGDRLTQLEGLIQKLVQAPQPRQSVSGLAPLAKSGEDVQPAGQAPATLSKSQMIDKLFELQKAEDKRVDSTVITRVEMGDFSVLTERGINLK
jgi:hypothetical protein